MGEPIYSKNHPATGLHIQAVGTVTLSNNIFKDNDANSQQLEYGGVISLYNDLTLTNNLFSGNTGYSAGGLQIVDSATPSSAVLVGSRLDSLK